jgi:hypothetical protein
MDKEVKSIDVVVKNNDSGMLIFEIKEPNKVSCKINDELKKDYSIYTDGSYVVYPEQKIIDSQKVFIDTSILL